ncbi:MAG: hypothetical protein AABX72_03410 [Nanoarchaeota archaeon]
MSLDVIQQTARSITDAFKLWNDVEDKTDEQSKKKRQELAEYILKLTYIIQKAIDEERETI